MALFEGYFGGAKKRQEQILKETGISGDSKPSIRTQQPAAAAAAATPKKKKGAFVVPPKPIHIRQADYPAWVAKRRAAHNAQ